MTTTDRILRKERAMAILRDLRTKVSRLGLSSMNGEQLVIIRQISAQLVVLEDLVSILN